MSFESDVLKERQLEIACDEFLKARTKLEHMLSIACEVAPGGVADSQIERGEALLRLARGKARELFVSKK